MLIKQVQTIKQNLMILSLANKPIIKYKMPQKSHIKTILFSELGADLAPSKTDIKN